jgi:hypothetical protein
MAENEDKARQASLLACSQELTKIVPRLFDQPEQALTLMRRIIERHGVHPSEITVGIGAIDEVRALRQEVHELMAAQVRQYDTFEVACASKGYVGEKALAQVANVEPSQIRNWKEIGRVPAVFFHKVATAPDLAMKKQHAQQERQRLREATRMAKKQLQDAAKMAVKKARAAKVPRKPQTAAERYEQARAASPDAYALAEARFAELAAAAHDAGEKRLPTARIFAEVNREAGGKLVREASARFAERLRADRQPPSPDVSKDLLQPTFMLDAAD